MGHPWRLQCMKCGRIERRRLNNILTHKIRFCNVCRNPLVNALREGVKSCSSCGIVKSLDEFNFIVSERSKGPKSRIPGGPSRVPSSRCKICCASATRLWQTTNAQKYKATKRNYDRRRRNAPGVGVQPRDWERLIKRFRSRCAYCDSEGDMTMDHVVPLSRGGTHSVGNILPACLSCNSSKNNKLLVEWRRDKIPGRVEAT